MQFDRGPIPDSVVKIGFSASTSASSASSSSAPASESASSYISLLPCSRAPVAPSLSAPPRPPSPSLPLSPLSTSSTWQPTWQPFANRTEMEEARKGATPAVLKGTLKGRSQCVMLMMWRKKWEMSGTNASPPCFDGLEKTNITQYCTICCNITQYYRKLT